jgi:hypothetical protein
MKRTVDGFAENVDPATLYMSENGLCGIEGYQIVPKAYICSHAYCKRFPNTMAMLAA